MLPSCKQKARLLALGLSCLLLAALLEAETVRLRVKVAHGNEPMMQEVTITLPGNREDVFIEHGWVRTYKHYYRDCSWEIRDDSRQSYMGLQGGYNHKNQYFTLKDLKWGDYTYFVKLYQQEEGKTKPVMTQLVKVPFQVLPLAAPCG